MKVVALISGGKDSCYSMLQCVAAGHEIVALAHLKPKDKDELDSYMYQSVGHHAVHQYAGAMGLPLFEREIGGTAVNQGKDYAPSEHDEVEDLYKLLLSIKESVNFDAVCSGAILSDYQRVRVENVCVRVGLVSLAYLWRQDQESLLDQMISSGIEAIIIKVAALGLSPDKHLGKTIKEMRPYLKLMKDKYGLNVCGEGGEYETFTLDCPLFKERIKVGEVEIVHHSLNDVAPVAYLNLKNAQSESKELPPRLSQKELLKAVEVPTPESYVKEFCGEDGRTERKAECSVSGWRNAQEINDKYGTFVSSKDGWTCVTAWVGSIGSGDSPRGETEKLMSKITESLHSKGVELSDLVAVYMYIRNMADYPLINTTYGSYFGINPPIRACVEAELPGGVSLLVDCLAHREPNLTRNTMHVQSISHWAPANIGPYSQAIKVDGFIYVAGQIGLVPGSMQLLKTGAASQSRLALRHIRRVLKAMTNESSELTSILHAVCYVTSVDDVAAVTSTWHAALEAAVEDERPLLDCVVVAGLPRGAAVEWQVAACEQWRHWESKTTVINLTENLTLFARTKKCRESQRAVIQVQTECVGDVTVGRSMVREVLAAACDFARDSCGQTGDVTRISCLTAPVFSCSVTQVVLEHCQGWRLTPCVSLVPVSVVDNITSFGLSMRFEIY